MGSTFIGIRSNGFWMRDPILELFLRLASLHIEDKPQEGSVAHQIRDEWLLASRGYFSGCVPISLEANTSTSEGKQVVVSAIESLLKGLRDTGPVLDRNVLNILGMSGMFSDFETARLIEVGEWFLNLINGEQFGGPGTSNYMPGMKLTE